MVDIVDLILKAVIDSFEIHTINSLIKKKSRLVYVQSFIWGSTTKKNKKY